MHTCGRRQLWLVIALTLLAVPIVLPGGFVVSVLLVLFWTLEVVVFGLRKLLDQPAEFPTLFWWS